MPTIHFILNDGGRRAVEAAAGDSVMLAATAHLVPGIEAICGGFCNCATCHVYVADAWLAKLPPPSADEDEMLDGTAADRAPNSRLSCQVKLTDALDGIEITMPDRQA